LGSKIPGSYPKAIDGPELGNGGDKGLRVAKVTNYSSIPSRFEKRTQGGAKDFTKSPAEIIPS
jgi:hypothetical protein